MPSERICRICGNSLKPNERHGLHEDICDACSLKTKQDKTKNEPVKTQKLPRPNQLYRYWYERHIDLFGTPPHTYYETFPKLPKQDKLISPPVHIPSYEYDSMYTSILKLRVPKPSDTPTGYPRNIYRNVYFVVVVVCLMIFSSCALVERHWEEREPRY